MTEDAIAQILSSNTLSALGVAVIIVIGGIQILRSIDKESPLAPFALQFAGLTILLPVILVLALVAYLPMEALTAFLGTIVGYLFGAKNDHSRTGDQ